MGVRPETQMGSYVCTLISGVVGIVTLMRTSVLVAWWHLRFYGYLCSLSETPGLPRTWWENVLLGDNTFRNVFGGGRWCWRYRLRIRLRWSVLLTCFQVIKYSQGIACGGISESRPIMGATNDVSEVNVIVVNATNIQVQRLMLEPAFGVHPNCTCF